MRHETREEARDYFLTESSNAMKNSDAFMAVVFTKNGNKLEIGVRTTYKFPVGDFTAIIGMLGMNLHDEILGELSSDMPSQLPKAFRFGGDGLGFNPKFKTISKKEQDDIPKTNPEN